MKSSICIVVFLLIFSALSAQETPSNNNTQVYCPDAVRLRPAEASSFRCNTENLETLIIHSDILKKGQILLYPGAQHTYNWSTDGYGTIEQTQYGSARYRIQEKDYKTGWIKVCLSFQPDPALGCSDIILKDSVQFFLMSLKIDAGEDLNICNQETAVEVNGTVYQDNNPGFSNLYTWETTGSGIFSNPYIANTTYAPSDQDISEGMVDLILKVRKSECRDDDYITDTITLKFGICNSVSQHFSGEKSLLIYPVPASDYISLDCPVPGGKKLKIFSADGSLVLDTDFSGDLLELSLELPDGIYKAVISGQHSILSKTFLIQH